MSKQISAVEWYENRIFILQIQLEKKEISLGEYSVTRVELFKQAKAMEKEQIIEACKQCSYSYEEAEQYYKETFKSENVVMFMNTENSGIESIKLTDNPDCGIKGITFKSE